MRCCKIQKSLLLQFKCKYVQHKVSNISDTEVITIQNRVHFFTKNVSWKHSKCLQTRYDNWRDFNVKQMSMFDLRINLTSILHQVIQRGGWRASKYFINFESWIYIELSTSNRFLCFDPYLSFIFKKILTNNFRFKIWTSNTWQIDKNVYCISVGYCSLRR